MALSGTFSYILIPANSDVAIQLKTGDKKGGLQDDELAKSAREYFFQQSGGAAKAAALANATPEEKKQLADQVRAQAAQNPKIQELSDDTIIELIR
jgi:hypothetical protein